VIVLAARRKEELEAVAAECRKLGGAHALEWPKTSITCHVHDAGDPCVCIADVGTEEGCKGVAEAAQRHMPSGIDYLVLNAGAIRDWFFVVVFLAVNLSMSKLQVILCSLKRPLPVRGVVGGVREGWR
jgi:NAD(P)-dependent dehydrogenase (short-subunit alcohol dehydrogenase family)